MDAIMVHSKPCRKKRLDRNMNIAPYILGLCTTFVSGDPVLTVSLCRLSWEAQQRVIVPANPLPEIPGFLKKVSHTDHTGCEGRC